MWMNNIFVFPSSAALTHGLVPDMLWIRGLFGPDLARTFRKKRKIVLFFRRVQKHNNTRWTLRCSGMHLMTFRRHLLPPSSTTTFHGDVSGKNNSVKCETSLCKMSSVAYRNLCHKYWWLIKWRQDLRHVFFPHGSEVLVGQGLLNAEFPRSHSYHTWLDFSGWVVGPSQRPLPDTQHSQETDIHDPGGIRTHNPSNHAAADSSLRRRSHRVRNRSVLA